MSYPPHVSIDDVTRRLCAGTYLADGFAYDVIRETVDDDYQAVAPSLGFDLEHVVRHAFRARKLLLNRDLLLSAVLLLGLLLVPGATLTWLLFSAGVRRWRAGRHGPRGERGRAVALILISMSTVIFLCCGGSPLLMLTLSSTRDEAGSGTSFEYPQPDRSPADSLFAGLNVTMLLWITVMLPVALGLTTAAILVGSRVTVFRTLTRTLAPGARVAPPDLPNPRVAQRVAWIAGAQRGNISLSTRNPFLGSGRKVDLWSMALALQGCPEPSGPASPGAVSPGGDGRFRRDATFDPRGVSAREIQREVRESVLGLAAASLPANQRVPGVYVLDRVVAGGERYQGDPLIDQYSGRPLAMASPEAIAAVTDHPQGGLRYYQQFLVGVEGRPVSMPDGRLVVPAQPQDIVVSAHLHVAVEGGKLYVEFLGTVLPPVRGLFNQVNRLRPDDGPLPAFARSGLLSALLDSPLAPARTLRYLRQASVRKGDIERSRREISTFRSYDHGANLSVRELGAEDWPVTFLQDLDAFKYIKLVEKTVLQTVLDHLDRRGVDTSEYRARMTHIQNTQTIMSSPNFQGPVAFGTGSVATQL